MSRHDQQLSCPRCGYDVSGVVPTWAEQCPLEGRCSECGLGFEWVDMFRPERVHPRWSFEHASNRRVRALAGTTVRAVAGGPLWRGLRLTAPIRVAPLLGLAIGLILATHLSAVIASWKIREPWMWLRGWTVVGGKTMSRTTFNWDELFSVLAWPYGTGWNRLIGPLGLLLIAWCVLAPIPYLLLPDTMAAAKVRRAHLFRAWVYALAPLFLAIFIDIAVTAFPVAWYRRMGYYMLTGWVLVIWNKIAGTLFAFAAAWLVRWWLLFTREYLQLVQPRRVLAAMLVISLLAALAICLGIDEQMRNAVGTPLNAIAGLWEK